MTDIVPWLKTFLGRRGEEIRAAHRGGADSVSTSVALSSMIDEAVRTTYETLGAHTGVASTESMAIFALGGYGRIELCPHSDIDILVVCDDAGEKAAAESTAQQFLRTLWDAGLQVGHAVRTVEEIMGLQGKDLTSWIAFLEGRPICGNAGYLESCSALLNRKPTATDDWLIGGILDDVAARHHRYGSSVKLLEPNVKNSAGGLRDLHALLWLRRGNLPGLNTGHSNVPAIPLLLQAFCTERLLDEEEFQRATAAFRFLLSVRHQMHYLRNRTQDVLEHTLQREVAEGLGYGARADVESVEEFMSQYYRHARFIHRLFRALSETFREQVRSSPVEIPGEPIGSIFVLHHDRLIVREGVQMIESPADVFEVFVCAAEREVDVDAKLQRIVERSASLISPENDALAPLFRRILSSRRVASTLRMMSDLGILGRYIPEFEALMAFYQYSVYHYFTADEHTLIALKHAEQLRERPGVLREVFRNLKRKEILYLAILFHDITKPRGIADHEITGVGVAETVLHRLGLDEIVPEVSFLIRYHLVMEQVAFRRNIHDPDTIREFTALFVRPELLDYLYVLTYADLSAVNTSVWTEWKAALLQELYQFGTEVLRRNLKGEAVQRFHEEKTRRATETVKNRLGVTFDARDIEEHLDGIQDDTYLSLFSDEEISQHIREAKGDNPVSILFAQQAGYTEVTVIARDAPFALAKFCAVLAANDANIIDASIFTRSDGIIIDRFRVSDVAGGFHLRHEVCEKISVELPAVLTGDVKIEGLFEAHRRKWKRRPKLPPDPRVRMDVAFETTPRFTIFDVYAPDSLGLLYRITESLSQLDLDIRFAKIATRVDGIVDAFYTVDRTGKPLATEQCKDVCRELLATVHAASEHMLT